MHVHHLPLLISTCSALKDKEVEEAGQTVRDSGVPTALGMKHDPLVLKSAGRYILNYFMNLLRTSLLILKRCMVDDPVQRYMAAS
jgi:hypothetical protein